MDERDYALTEMDRRMGNMLRFGTIAAVDAANALVQVDLGEGTTDWVPWLTRRAGNNRVWAVPEMGEQVVMLTPGDPSQGVVLGSIFQDAHPANGDNPDLERATYKDGTVVEYDRAAHQLLVDASASSGTVLVKCKTGTVQASESVTLDTPDTKCTGNLTVQKALNVVGEGVSGQAATVNGGMNFVGGTVTHDGKNIGGNHAHTGVASGSDNSGPPV